MDSTDADELFAIYGDPEVMEFASDEPFRDVGTVSLMLNSVDRLHKSGESIEWAVVEAATGRLVGTCGLHSFDRGERSAEVGCMLVRDMWGHGFMSEALPAIFAYAQGSLEVGLLLAEIDEPNFRSRSLFVKLGFNPVSATMYALTLSDGPRGSADSRGRR